MHELGLKDLPVIVLSSTSDHETKLRLFRAATAAIRALEAGQHRLSSR